MSAAAGLLAVLILTLATGYFVAQEFAFVASDRGALRDQAASGDAAARRALEVTGRLSFMLSGAQLGITVTTLLVGFVAQPAIADVIRSPLRDLGVPDTVVAGLAVAIGVAVATIIQMIFGELAPKNVGIARPEAVAKFLARSTLLYLKIAGPVIHLFDAAATRLVRLVGIEPVEELEHGATPDELSRIVADSASAGEVPPRLAELLKRSLEFGDHVAEDVMVPRPRVVSLRADRPVADLLQSLREHGRSRYPVLGTDTDDVVGVTGVREYLEAGSPSAGLIGDLTRPPLLVPTTLPLPQLLRRMSASGDTFACVIDEYGGLAGVLTIEDLAEELVGELVDENDPEPLGVVRHRDGTWDVPGTLRLDEVERATGVALPESEDYETIAGLVLASLGRIAEPGDEVTTAVAQEADLFRDDEPEVHRARLKVLSVHRHVPEWVRLGLHDEEADGERPGEEPAADNDNHVDYAPELFSALFQGRPA
ncbi:hemolysin family protein [Planotetraspora kaengkrachanensis]|uniref:Membrane protein n=1 Tax=Planotetraspora kaengkrachanensis TaxID=575193 RepID=A0A8J3PTX6_9ACTN|nr:hemolysin family protein [Planotetraspora kaengkrachanensis]GIG80961.1 membrane protein [Planotetraspora kaengkrachanensis]